LFGPVVDFVGRGRFDLLLCERNGTAAGTAVAAVRPVGGEQGRSRRRPFSSFGGEDNFAERERTAETIRAVEERTAGEDKQCCWFHHYHHIYAMALSNPRSRI
jgi:hypothetical protein